jgi:hypothetical protein
MKNWVAGKHESAARVDPAIAAIITSVVDLIVMLDLHTKLGIAPEQLLGVLLHVAVIATLLRTVQTNYKRKPKPKEAAPEPEAEVETPQEPEAPEPE